ncbi:hypothetical protein SERLA73DRAFT_59592 [Serpula lacrymans var. lacrymans S7.3]|uniref:Uncharacterized protein n=2 Tax=Serpula lacrymans var. lacrymans TaxID=341189 RepID=F8Q5D2_SERL3|nr:hypothetical protein SERLA73DRAFT_59592 [Serpula lacrymans var. lacrymans S7.3]
MAAPINEVAALKTAFSLLLIGTVLSSCLIPILIALFVFSNASSRRRPVFWVNIASILLGLAEGGVNIYGVVHNMLSPNIPPLPGLVTALPALSTLVPFIAEFALVLRIIAVYPYTTTPRLKFAAILAPTVLCKVLRLAFLITFLVKFDAAVQGSVSSIADGEALWGIWEPRAVWILECIDNG